MTAQVEEIVVRMLLHTFIGHRGRVAGTCRRMEAPPRNCPSPAGSMYRIVRVQDSEEQVVLWT